jgi:hypothetical protein
MFSQDTAERYGTLLDEKIIHIWESAAASKGEDLYPWTPYSITRAKKIWRDYMRFGFVRDERGVEDMVENFVDKIVTLDASTTLLGHTPQNPQEIIEGFELAYFESIHDHLCDYLCDKDGTHYISDYGLKPLQEIAGKLLDASTVEEKLLLLDRVLNVVHQRSDLSSWFVRGGRAMLDELSNEEHLCAI